LFAAARAPPARFRRPRSHGTFQRDAGGGAKFHRELSLEPPTSCCWRNTRSCSVSAQAGVAPRRSLTRPPATLSLCHRWTSVAASSGRMGGDVKRERAVQMASSCARASCSPRCRRFLTKTKHKNMHLDVSRQPRLKLPYNSSFPCGCSSAVIATPPIESATAASSSASRPSDSPREDPPPRAFARSLLRCPCRAPLQRHRAAQPWWFHHSSFSVRTTRT